MFKEFLGRKHGDAGLIVDNSFYEPVAEEAREQYLDMLSSIIKQAQIPLEFSPQDSRLADVLLALKQRLMIGYSNGCPWPERAIIEDLQDIEKQRGALDNLEELAIRIRETAQPDGKRSFLFQMLLQHASPALKKELLSYHGWAKLDKQEDDHLPKEITDPNGEGAYGLAYDPPYFEVIMPLFKFIEADQDLKIRQARYFAVIDFFEKRISKVDSIDGLVKQTKDFLDNPKYFKQYLPKAR